MTKSVSLNAQRIIFIHSSRGSTKGDVSIKSCIDVPILDDNAFIALSSRIRILSYVIELNKINKNTDSRSASFDTERGYVLYRLINPRRYAIVATASAPPKSDENFKPSPYRQSESARIQRRLF